MLDKLDLAVKISNLYELARVSLVGRVTVACARQRFHRGVAEAGCRSIRPATSLIANKSGNFLIAL